MKFLVWDAVTGSRKEARPIEADKHKRAAIEFAEMTWTPNSGDQMDVMVLRLGADKAILYTIDVDFDVSFSAMEFGKMDPEREEEVEA